MIDNALYEGMKEILSKPVAQSTLFDTIIRLFSNEEFLHEEVDNNRNFIDGFDNIIYYMVISYYDKFQSD